MKTAMQELVDKLHIVVDDLNDAVHGTDPYGYRAAMQNVIKDIEVQMLEIERREIILAYMAGYGDFSDKGQYQADHYYAKMFNQWTTLERSVANEDVQSGNAG